ncbi:MAG: hypothetical protein GF375_07690 [Candidatus Omnitrophica bacterium]|nr:hypothetical protein [Candidatus Omnitrophota bacterium]MBD3269845.1 hypothetical protein [Candidatus Omnitrophota bacterium]
MLKIKIVHAGFGEGHKQAASSAADCFGTGCLDLIEFARFTPLKKASSFGYYVLTQRFPILWQALFNLSRFKPIRTIFNLINRFIFSDFISYIREEKPEIVITTHFFIPYLVKKAVPGNVNIITIITDLRVHPWWLDGESDIYFAPLDITEQDLLGYGVSREKIVCGFAPLRQGFVRQESRNGLKKDSLMREKEGILFVSSSRGRFPFFKEVFEEINKDFRAEVIYGHNEKLKNYLESKKNVSISFYPFYQNMWELFSRNDIIVSKPGGLTIFEGIYKRKFFIFTHYIPGQEKANMEVLLEKGVGVFAPDVREFQKALDYYKHNKNRLRNDYPIQLKGIKDRLKETVQSFTGAESKPG